MKSHSKNRKITKTVGKNRKQSRTAKKQKSWVLPAIAAAVVLTGGIFVYNLPSVRADRNITKARQLMTTMDYVQAEEKFQEALSIDSTAAAAYRGLADDYLAQGKQEEAETILLQGYEATANEVLLQNYCAAVLNDIAGKLNSQSAGWAEVDRCLQVLEKMPENQEAVGMMNICYERIVLAADEKGAVTALLHQTDGTDHFPEYEAVMQRMLSLYQDYPLEEIRQLICNYAVLQGEQVYLSLEHADAYENILNQVIKLTLTGGETNTENAQQKEEMTQLLACLDSQENILSYFAPMFEAFEKEEFEAARDFIVTEEYTGIRDAFINQTMEYWIGTSHIPVTREAIVFSKKDGVWGFSFADDDTKIVPGGKIEILGAKTLDKGVQRSSITWTPAYDPKNYYPHTEYEVTYWNTMVSGLATDGTGVARMNYRFAEKIYNKDGMETRMIHDWGGPNEARSTY